MTQPGAKGNHMKDFKIFLEKVLAPIQDEGEPALVQSTPPGERLTPPEAVPDKEFERRYVEVMNALLTDAEEHRTINVLTDVVAWKLAVIAYQFGPGAAGDIVRKLGAHLTGIAAAQEAQRESTQAKKEGRRLN